MNKNNLSHLQISLKSKTFDLFYFKWDKEKLQILSEGAIITKTCRLILFVSADQLINNSFNSQFELDYI